MAKTINVSKRARKTPPSPIRKLVPFAIQAKKQGVNVYHLNIGQPDIKSPPRYLKALKTYPEKTIAYENSLGNPDLRQALADYYLNYNIKVSSENIIVTTGGSEAIVFALLATCDPGDQCLILEPFYANYLGFAHMANVNLKPIPTSSENNFHLPLNKTIKQAITKQTKAIIVVNPNNPTGTVYTKKELLLINKIARQHKLFIIADETYREFVYGKKKHHSLLSLSRDQQHLILVDSLSKRYSLCGARVGCLVSTNKDILNVAGKFAQARLSAPSVAQYAARQALKTPISYFQKIKKEYQKRRDVLFNGLNTIPGVKVKKPEGAFYLIAELPVDNAEEFAAWLLTHFRYNNATVMVAPAAGFYISKGLGTKKVRIAYVLNSKDLFYSIVILRTAIAKYQSEKASLALKLASQGAKISKI